MKTIVFGLLGLCLAAAIGLRVAASGPEPEPAPTPAPVTSPAPAAPAALDLTAVDPEVVQVWKSPTCGCCSDWMDHLREAGYRVEARDVSNLAQVKAQLGVPGAVHSCHTALIDGYLVEGHVPAADVDRLLRERPDVAGIGVPGMPLGSPGMEFGDEIQPYDVLAFTGDGTTRVWSSHGK